MSRRPGLGGGSLLGMDREEGLAFLRCGFKVVDGAWLRALFWWC
jgi:hypothetical protein